MKKIVSICDYLDLEKDFESFLSWILDLRKKLNIPNKLSDVVDCTNLDLDKLSLMAFEDPSTSGNPKKFLKKILERCMNIVYLEIYFNEKNSYS